MSKDLVTVSPEDTFQTIHEIFSSAKFHHIPVVLHRKLVGILSSSDYHAHLKQAISKRESHYKTDDLRVKDIMTSKVAKLDDYDRVNVAIEVFKKNYFHSLPVIDRDGDLVGIVTTHDIIKQISIDEDISKEY